MQPYLEKVTAFVTRRTPRGLELLLFQHPTAGIQLPAGSVEEGEALEEAALREAREETGVTDLRLIREVGMRDELPPGITHVIFRGTPVYSRPDPASFDWAAFRRGVGVRLERVNENYAQVSYIEGDRYPDPHYVSYQITGWVPLDCLAAANRRHFFLLETGNQGPQRWQCFSDNHRFEPFWSPVDDLPEVVDSQRAWIEIFLQAIGEP